MNAQTGLFWKKKKKKTFERCGQNSKLYQTELAWGLSSKALGLPSMFSALSSVSTPQHTTSRTEKGIITILSIISIFADAQRTSFFKYLLRLLCFPKRKWHFKNLSILSLKVKAKILRLSWVHLLFGRDVLPVTGVSISVLWGFIDLGNNWPT